MMNRSQIKFEFISSKKLNEPNESLEASEFSNEFDIANIKSSLFSEEPHEIQSLKVPKCPRSK